MSLVERSRSRSRSRSRITSQTRSASQGRSTSQSRTATQTTIVPDPRIIDLDKPFEEITLPAFFHQLRQPINMTLCAGDGIQSKGNQSNITDIEWFTTGREGFDRETKPTTIFMVTKNYSPTGLELNKQYLRSHPELKVILLVYDDESTRYKENLVRLFPNLISNIYEDQSCYGDKLDLKTLYGILNDGGKYLFDYADKTIKFIEHLYLYKDYLQYFTVNFDKMPYSIKKDNGNRLSLNEKEGWVDFNAAVQGFRHRAILDAKDRSNRRKAKGKLSGGKKRKSNKRKTIKR